VYRLFVPITAVAFSQNTLAEGSGLLPLFGIDGIFLILTGFLLLDLVKYMEHRLFHTLKTLWRLHLIHHNDLDIDFTTTERHHPIEYILGLLVIYGTIYLFGIPPLAVVIYFLLGATIPFFSHANIRIPSGFDRALSYLFVTPQFHGVHHSPNIKKTNSNYGLVLTIWDRLFNTYQIPETTAENPYRAGLEYYREPHYGKLLPLLYLPLKPLPSIKLEDFSSEKTTD
jgi:sterol desaturase/sphingolipid hydroxylase (fatty acid hydroxylase superfamily)